MEVALHKLRSNNKLCPLRAINNMLARYCAVGRDPLIRVGSGSKVAFLSSLRFYSLFHSTLRHVGPPTTNVSAHSFRLGAASYAISVGILAEQLKS